MAASIKILYEETPENDRMLKDVAIKFAASSVEKFLDRGEFVTLCKERGDVSLDLLKSSLKIPCRECTQRYGGSGLYIAGDISGNLRSNSRAGIRKRYSPIK